MTPAFWISEAADEFWGLVGSEEPFPRTLRRSIGDALTLTLVELPHLRVAAAEGWLRRCGVVCAIGAGDRALHAALVARYGQGFLFFDGADGDDEQRLSLAHELAHFLRHYRAVRQRVERQLGAVALEVLDGLRPASRTERLQALLAGVPIGYYVHLMHRDDDGSLVDGRTRTAEREADLLAYELLAPAALVSEQVVAASGQQRQREAETALRGQYGFPPAAAVDYAARLFPSPVQSYVRHLGIVR